MSIREEVLLLTDRFYNASDPDAIDRQSQLQQCLLIVLCLYVMMAIAFWRGYEFEKMHPRILHYTEVAFVFNPPPQPTPELFIKPKGPGPTLGPEPSPEAPKQPRSKSPNLPTQHPPKPSKPPAKQGASHKGNLPIPIATIPTGALKPPALPHSHNTVGVSQPTNVESTNVPQNNTANTGTGTSSTGLGHGQGDTTGTGGEPIKTEEFKRLPKPGFGNIAPYKLDMMLRLAHNWKPKNVNQHLIVLIAIAHNGNLVGSEIFQSSGHKKFDKQALEAVSNTTFAELPEWYLGKQLTFKIDLTSMTAL